MGRPRRDTRYRRTNITLSVKLLRALNAAPKFNRSAFCESALWIVIRDPEVLEQEVTKLREENERLRSILADIHERSKQG